MGVVNDLLSETRIVEEGGMIIHATRAFLCTQVLGQTLGAIWYDALWYSGVPWPGAILDPVWPYMICVRRTPEYIGQDADGYAQVKVICEYERMFLEDRVQLIRGGSNLAQVSADRDAKGDLLTRQNAAGDTIELCADVYNIQSNFSCETLERTDDPDTLAAEWVNCTNEDTWRGLAKGSWLCTDAQFEMVSSITYPGNKRMYKFIWTFEARGLTAHLWQYRAIPKSTEEDQSLDKWFDWHKSRNFGDKFRWA